MTENPNPLLADSPHEWERLLESVEPASLLLVIERRMTAALKRDLTPEDILQETLLHAWRDRRKFEWHGLRGFRSWLLGIIDHRIQDAADRSAAAKRGGGQVAVPLSSLGRRGDGTNTSAAPDFPDGSTTPSRLAMYREQAEMMKTALGSIPEEFRDIVRLRLFEQCTLEEIARNLDISVSAVRHRLRKGSDLYTREVRSALGSSSTSRRAEFAADPRPESSPSDGASNEA